MRSDNEIYNELSRAGFTLLRKRRHQVWACPCGRHLLTCQSTPGGGRSNINAITTMRRVLRACEEGAKAA